MNPTKNCFDLIKHFESLQLKAYLCPAGVWTIGYGHTKGVKEGDICNEEQADSYLKQDVQETVDGVNKYVNGSLNGGQFDALVSFAFNVGVGAFRQCTLLKLVNGCRYDAAAMEFRKWVNSKGKVLDGLVKRRAAEAWLFKTSTLKL